MRPPQLKSLLDRYGAAAVLIYAVLALGFFGRSLGDGLSAAHLGRGPDPAFFMWLLVWWPHALAHHENPFLSPNVWAPSGFNLAWETGIPLASILMAPLTKGLGVVASYNLLCMLCPILAGWSGYILTRHLGARWPAALIAGYIFGFSPYMLGQMLGGHPTLMLVFPVPLFLLLGLKAYEGAITPATFGAIAIVLIVTQFLFSAEVAATMEGFAALALLLAWYSASAVERAGIGKLMLSLILANLGAAVLLLPYLYSMFAHGVPPTPINSPVAYSTDLVNFVVPTPTALIGVTAPLKAITERFSGNFGEAGGYIALPLLVIVALYACAHWSETAPRLLLLMLA
ncbi:MAG TPA: hypothetical protein VHY56_08270, partial [Candidatus Binataceae bacterium]|nr:hypothetical protein [Candidatus Binataceae bacterium]